MQRRGIRTLIVPVVATLALVVTSGTAQALPSTATHVSVTAGSTTPDINAALAEAASIAGKVTFAGTTTPVSSVLVTSYLNGQLIETAITNAGGLYTLTGLAPSSVGYTVCISGYSVFGGPSRTGYLGRCYKTAAFDGTAPPSTATRVLLTSDLHKTGINIAVPSGAAITGKAMSNRGKGLARVSIFAHNLSTGRTTVSFTGASGKYTLTGLAASAKGYAVCFNPASVVVGTGFRPRCYKTAPWNGRTFPKSVKKVRVALGKTTSRINAKLHRGGAISGSVIDNSGKPVPFTDVEVRTPKGAFVASVATNAKGRYVVRSLAASKTAVVCAAPEQLSPAVSYGGACWKSRTWKGGKLPTGVATVRVRTAKTHRKVNFKVAKQIIHLGSIAGTITEKAGGKPLRGATVTVFGSGESQQTVTTNSSGGYVVKQLLPSSAGYAVCIDPTNAVSATTKPATGWVPRCYSDAAWPVPTRAAGSRVAIGSGQQRTGINISVPVGGAISGAVTTPSHAGIAGVVVKLFDTSGNPIASVLSGFDGGTYAFTGVTPKTASKSDGYIVCFDGRITSDTSPGYLPQCFNNIAWSGQG